MILDKLHVAQHAVAIGHGHAVAGDNAAIGIETEQAPAPPVARITALARSKCRAPLATSSATTPATQSSSTSRSSTKYSSRRAISLYFSEVWNRVQHVKTGLVSGKPGPLDFHAAKTAHLDAAIGLATPGAAPVLHLHQSGGHGAQSNPPRPVRPASHCPLQCRQMRLKAVMLLGNVQRHIRLRLCANASGRPWRPGHTQSALPCWACSAAAMAARKPAPPPPTTSTSKSACFMHRLLRVRFAAMNACKTGLAGLYASRRQRNWSPVRLAGQLKCPARLQGRALRHAIKNSSTVPES